VTEEFARLGKSHLDDGEELRHLLLIDGRGIYAKGHPRSEIDLLANGRIGGRA
jgi:hypothetical protein